MGWLATVGAVIKLIFIILNKWFERDAEIKKQKEEAAKMVSDGIKTRDRSAITAGFSRFKQI
jgi:hypothetical protein